jgi:hypothetical protein
MRYIVYKGDDIRCMGTAKECAEIMGVKMSTFKHYLTPSYNYRIEQRAERKVIRWSKGVTVVLPMEDYIQNKLNG